MSEKEKQQVNCAQTRTQVAAVYNNAISLYRQRVATHVYDMDSPLNWEPFLIALEELDDALEQSVAENSFYLQMGIPYNGTMSHFKASQFADVAHRFSRLLVDKNTAERATLSNAYGDLTESYVQAMRWI
jgi:hypothetical protein